MGLSNINDVIVNILPKAPEAPKSLIDVIKGSVPKTNDLFNLLNLKLEMELIVVQFNKDISSDKDSGLGYERYLQVGESAIEMVAKTIVSPTDTNDEKIYKIEQWVKEHVKYVSDIKNYKQSEYWALPTQTIARGKGDCEDGAFLIHSLALAADVPAERLRTYGGLVTNPQGILPAGHAWTAYKRETDNEWVICDWCYWPTEDPIADRTSMSSNLKYIDDFFFVESTRTVETPLTNRVRYAKGMLLNKVA